MDPFEQNIKALKRSILYLIRGWKIERNAGVENVTTGEGQKIFSGCFVKPVATRKGEVKVCCLILGQEARGFTYHCTL